MKRGDQLRRPPEAHLDWGMRHPVDGLTALYRSGVLGISLAESSKRRQVAAGALEVRLTTQSKRDPCPKSTRSNAKAIPRIANAQRIANASFKGYSGSL
jgi:hypothetical protein